MSSFEERALSLIKGNDTVDDALETKGLGLHLILLSLAEIQSQRISQMGKLVKQLEEKVFKEDKIKDLNPSEAVAYYKLARKSLEEAYTYVGSVVKGFDWVEVQNRLIGLSAKEVKKDTKLTEVAKVLLKKLSLIVNLEMLEEETSFNQGDVVDIFPGQPVVLKERRNRGKS